MHNSPVTKETVPDSAKENEGSVEEAQKQMQEQYNQEVPDIQQGNYLLQLALGLALIPASNRLKTLDAFVRITDPDFVYKLLDVRDPQKLEEIKKQMRLAGKEVAKQREKYGDKRDYAQVGKWKLSRRINFSTFDKKRNAVRLADVVHNKLHALEIKQKFDNAIQIYGIKDGALIKQFKGGFADWLNKNPGGTIDQYVAINGRSFFCRQNSLDEKHLTQEQQKKVKDCQKKVYEQNQDVRVELIKQEREMIARGREEILKASDPKSKPQTEPEINQAIQRVVKGEIVSPVQITPQTPPQTVQPIPQAAVQPTASPPVAQTITPPPVTAPVSPQPIFQTAISPPVVVPATTNIPTTLQKPTSFSLPLPQRISSFLSGLKEGIGGRIGSFLTGGGGGLGGIFKGLGGITKGIGGLIASSGLKVGLKALLAGALTGATGGLFGVAMAALELINQIPVLAQLKDSTVKIFFIIVVCIIGGLVLLPILGLSAASQPFAHITTDNPLVGRANLFVENTLGWNSFESKYLTLLLSSNSQQALWSNFEKNYILTPEKYLTLKNSR